MKVLVHIGSTKTGSSALQNFLNDNRDSLREKGVLYPETGIVSGAHHLVGASVHQGAWRMHTDVLGPDGKRLYAALQNSLAGEIASFDGKLVILSTEYLWTLLDKTELVRFLAGAGIHHFDVFCYVREVTSWLQSQYNQSVKSGLGERFQGWLQRTVKLHHGGARYFTNLSEWANLEQVGRVTARLYSEETLPNGLFHDFLESQSIPTDALDHRTHQHVNASPETGEVQLLAAINRSQMPDPEKVALRDFLRANTPIRKVFSPFAGLLDRDHEFVVSELKNEMQECVDQFLVPEHRAHTLLTDKKSNVYDLIDTILASNVSLMKAATGLKHPAASPKSDGLLTLREACMAIGRHQRRLENVANPRTGHVPHRVFQFWDTDPDEQVARILEFNKEFCDENHYEYVLFNEQDALNYLEVHDGTAAAAFMTAVHPAMKSDIIRLVYLFNEGGFYLDADMAFRPNAAALLQSADRGIVLKWNAKERENAPNWFFGFEPGHPFIGKAADQTANAVLQEMTHNPENALSRILSVSGPGMFTRSIGSAFAEAGDAVGVNVVDVDEAYQYLQNGPELLGEKLEYKSTSLHWLVAAKGN